MQTAHKTLTLEVMLKVAGNAARKVKYAALLHKVVMILVHCAVHPD